jgi:DNA-3-methyladenine glycosylase
MPLSSILPQTWYQRDVVTVARELLGKRLVRVLDGQRLSGIIVEAEAYRGEEDLACHARAGRTPRTEVMYGPPGRAYVYFTYGMHWMLNTVCSEQGFPAAALIRAILPLEGINTIAASRAGRPRSAWTNGPAKLTQALHIDSCLNGADLTGEDANLWIEEGIPIPETWVSETPRIGIGSVPEPWKSLPWRFLAELPEGFQISTR